MPCILKQGISQCAHAAVPSAGRVLHICVSLTSPFTRGYALSTVCAQIVFLVLGCWGVGIYTAMKVFGGKKKEAAPAAA